MSSNLANQFDLKDEKQAKEYLDTLGVEYRFQCYKEKRPDGCHRLGDYMEAFKKDMQKARKVYENNCNEHNYGKSCFKCGIYYHLGRGGAEKSDPKAYEYFEKGCNSDHFAACTNAAMMLHSERIKHGANTFVKAAEYLDKSCSGKDHEACYYLSSYYLLGREGIPKDLNKALQYAEKGCDMGNMAACSNISQMYKRGDGVEQNLELAQKYRKKAEEIYNEYKEVRKYMEFSK